MLKQLSRSFKSRHRHESKDGLTGKAIFVNCRIEEALAPSFSRRAVPFVFNDVGNDVVIETDFTSIQGIESTVHIEVGADNRQAKTLDGFEGGL